MVYVKIFTKLITNICYLFDEGSL